MWESLTEHIGIVGSVLTGAVSIAGILAWQRVVALEKRVGAIEKTNQGLSEKLDLVKLEIIKAVTEVQLDLARNYVRKGECAKFNEGSCEA